jgi:hypothetical protein
MGNKNASRETYADSEYDEETEIRQFEEDSGAYRKNLNSILSRICIERDLINVPNIEEFLKKEFTDSFNTLLHHEFFFKEHNGTRYFDAKKLKLCLFLLTNDSKVDNGRVKYHDKASFVITHCKVREDDDLNFPIQKTDKAFEEFCSDMFDVACVGLVDAYVKLKNVKRDGYLQRLRQFKEKCIEKIADKLIEDKNAQASEGLTFNDLNRKFENDPWFLTSGWVREISWSVLKGGANELEAKDREEARKEALEMENKKDK